MEKGLLIMLVVFVIVGILHFISMRMMKISEINKQKYRKLFWYFYGVIFALSGLVNLIEKKELNFIFLTQLMIGLLIIILNFLNKIETKKINS